MPELPDVEIFKRYLNATALHRKIAKVRAADDRVLTGVSLRTLQRRMEGHQFLQTDRHGKHLFVKIEDDGWLMLHFGMTGFLQFYKKTETRPDHVRFEVEFEDGYRLAYDNQRLLGRVAVTKHPRTFASDENLGPDAKEDLSPGAFRDLMQGRSGMIKSTLMNQEVIAGIGNVYADEILFQAGIHPKVSIEDLSGEDLERVYRAMQTVFEKAVAAKAQPEDMPEDFLLPRRQPGEPCPRCGGTVEKIKVSGRSGYMCPECQSAEG